MATLGLTMKSLNGNTQVTTDTVSQWERDTLATAINSPSLVNNPSIKGVFCLLSQPDNSLVDNWFSAAIMTHPIAELTSSNTPSTSGGGTPASDPNNVHVEVAAPKK
jgi:hypothetical protein